MSQRFFVESPISHGEATISGSEAHHLLHVMRAKVGDEVVLFDGSGAEFPARIAELGRSDALLTVLARQEISREAARRLTLGVALPKGDRQRWLVEKCVELGVAKLIPLETRRGVAQPEPAALERLRRAVIEASKQCGRNRLMEITSPLKFGDFLRTAPDSAVNLVAHPRTVDVPAMSLRTALHEVDLSATCCVAIGPEGGLADEEVRLALELNWRAVELGSRILRVETAALAIAANCLLDA